jgi:hypothetical protein
MIHHTAFVAIERNGSMRNDSQRLTHLLFLALVLGALLAACGSSGEDEPMGEPGVAETRDALASATTVIADVELAPELIGLEDWVNSPPLTLAELRGEPVLLVFWASW